MRGNKTNKKKKTSQRTSHKQAPRLTGAEHVRERRYKVTTSPQQCKRYVFDLSPQGEIHCVIRRGKTIYLMQKSVGGGGEREQLGCDIIVFQTVSGEELGGGLQKLMNGIHRINSQHVKKEERIRRQKKNGHLSRHTPSWPKRTVLTKRTNESHTLQRDKGGEGEPTGGGVLPSGVASVGRVRGCGGALHGGC